MKLPPAKPPLGDRVAKRLVVHARPAVHRTEEIDERIRDRGADLLAQGEETALDVRATELVKAPVKPLRRVAFEKSSIP